MKTIISMHLKRCLYRVRQNRSILSQLTQSHFISRCAFAAFLLMATAAPNVFAGLVGHWTFDEGAGLVAADSSGNGRTGTLMAAPGGSNPTWISDGIRGSVLNFDGTGYVDIANTASDFNFGASGFTIAAWARYSTLIVEDSMIVGKHNAGFENGYFLDALPPDTLGFFDNANATRVIATTAYNDNQWHFVVGTNDGAIGRLYVDGQYIDSRPGTPLDNSRDLMVGGAFTYFDTFVAGFTGSIDDVRVYNNALTQAEISQLYSVAEPNSVPEPGTLSLAVFSTAAYLLLRRKSRRNNWNQSRLAV